MESKYKGMIKNIIIFLFTMFIPKVINFLLMPLYTNKMTTEEYGIADLLNNIVSVIYPFLTLGICDAMLRFSMDEEEDANAVYTFGMRVIRYGGIILAAACVLVYWVISVGKSIVLPGWYFGYTWISYYLASAWACKTYFCKGIGKAKCLMYGASIQAILLGSLSIIFVGFLGLGLKGYLIAYILARLSGVGTVHISGGLKKYYVNAKIEVDLCKRMVKYSFPFIFVAIGFWINNASDKYILRFFFGESEVGILAVSYKIPTIISALSSVFIYAYQISLVKEAQENNPSKFVSICYKTIRAGGVLLCSLLIILNVFFAKIMFAKDFFIAWKYAPPLVMAMFGNLMAMMCQQSLLPEKKTGMIGWQCAISAVINIFLNFILISCCGTYGASIATMIAFWIQWMIGNIIACKKTSLKRGGIKELVIYIFMIIQMIYAYWEINT